MQRAQQRAGVGVRGMRLGRRLGRADVQHHDAVERVALAERAQVGGDARDRGARLGARLAVGDARAHLGLRGGELRGDGLGHPGRDHAAVDEPRGAHRERRLDDVVAAEDEVAQLRQAGVRERRAAA